MMCAVLACLLPQDGLKWKVHAYRIPYSTNALIIRRLRALKISSADVTPRIMSQCLASGTHLSHEPCMMISV